MAIRRAQSPKGVSKGGQGLNIQIPSSRDANRDLLDQDLWDGNCCSLNASQCACVCGGGGGVSGTELWSLGVRLMVSRFRNMASGKSEFQGPRWGLSEF